MLKKVVKKGALIFNIMSNRIVSAIHKFSPQINRHSH